MLQTLVAETVVRKLSFSSDDSYLETDRGLLDIGSLSPSSISSLPKAAHHVFVKGRWIAHGLERFLWLPSDYRATCAAVHGNVLVLGHASGRVTVIGFDLAYAPW